LPKRGNDRFGKLSLFEKGGKRGI